MSGTILTNRQGVHLPHSDVISLRAKGLLNLGIENDLAEKISVNKALGPTRTTATAAFHFWNWIAIGIFFGSVYWSFTRDWWWFIIGFMGMRMLWKANTKGNADNLLDAAMVDPEFYNRVLALDGWMYQVPEENLAEFSRYRSKE